MVKLFAASINLAPKGGEHFTQLGTNVILPWEVSLSSDLFPAHGLSAYQPQHSPGVCVAKGRNSLRGY